MFTMPMTLLFMTGTVHGNEWEERPVSMSCFYVDYLEMLLFTKNWDFDVIDAMEYQL